MDTRTLTANELLVLLIHQALKRRQQALKLNDKQVTAIMHVIAPIIGGQA